MTETTMSQALVFTLLRRAEDFAWRMQDIGLMGLRPGERREYRLHVRDQSLSSGAFWRSGQARDARRSNRWPRWLWSGSRAAALPS
jgi:hypothetical protein